jgi:hypothetical protein
MYRILCDDGQSDTARCFGELIDVNNARGLTVAPKG